MKIAVLSDIHGNDVALKTCLAYFKQEKADAYCFLGDYIGELPGNAETIQILQKLAGKAPCYMVKGNKEEYQLGGLGDDHPEWDKYPSLVGMIRYGRKQLVERDLRFIRALPSCAVVREKGMEELLLCHASPKNTKKLLCTPDWTDEEALGEIGQKYILYGHTHRAGDTERGGVRFLNPGSVGLQLSGSRRAECMLLHGKDGEWEPEFVSLAYDYEEVISRMQRKGFYEIAPYWSKVTEHLLRGGRISHGAVLKLAMELCFQETGECEWPRIDERFMADAYDRLIGGQI